MLDINLKTTLDNDKFLVYKIVYNFVNIMTNYCLSLNQLIFNDFLVVFDGLVDRNKARLVAKGYT